MGALYSLGGGYAYTPTIGGGSESVRGTLAVPPGSLAGLFHNHPGPERSSEDFSPEDKAQARRLGKPSYIQTPSMALRRFDPLTGTTTNVLAEIPVEQIHRLMIAEALGPSQ